MLKTVASQAATTGNLTYAGTWNASTNSPTLTSGVGNLNNYYVVSVAGSTNLDGITDWQVGDWAIFNGTVWQKIDQTNTVTSVNGQVGAVVLGVANIAGAVPNTVNVLSGTGLSGGGALTGNVTISMANTAVTPAAYGAANIVPTFTVDQQGRLTAAANVTIAIANTQVSGLGTMSTQNANNVTITGGAANLTTGNVTNFSSGNVAITGGSINVQTTNLTSTTSASATFATSSLPLVPAGYIQVDLNGTVVKIPYYAV